MYEDKDYIDYDAIDYDDESLDVEKIDEELEIDEYLNKVDKGEDNIDYDDVVDDE